MYRPASLLIHPLPLFFLLSTLALINLWRKRKEGRARLLLVTVPFVALLVSCLPAASYLALGSLEWLHPPVKGRPRDAQVIVVLSGGLIAPDEIRERAELAPNTLYRCLHALDLYRRGSPVPILVSGGKVEPDEPGPTHAEAMRDFLVEMGVPASDVILEDRSRDTFENGVECARLLPERGIKRVILVTEAMHLARAVGVFRKQGIEPIPSGCNYRATEFDFYFSDFVPNPVAAGAFNDAFHEWIGLALYRLQGKI
jgi:uncharacterized SAM-binding protein YcdF (DUF218 family)